MKEIQLSKNGKHKGKYVALVDDEDFEYLNQFNWYVCIERNNTYAARRKGKNKWYMHNEILNCLIIDHIDRNGLNNQKSNFRKCTQYQNLMNSRPHKNSSSKYKGVRWNKQSNSWKCSIYLNRICYNIGYFKNEIEAAKAYDEKAKELFGEFAYLNFPNK